MASKKINDYIPEMEEITLPIPKNAELITVTTIYDPIDMTGLNVQTLSYTKEDIKEMRKVKE